MKNTTAHFLFLILLACFACKNTTTPTVSETPKNEVAVAKPVFDDGYPNHVTDVMLDSIFDFYFITQHKNLCKRAKLRFEQELKRVISTNPTDSLALLQVHRRLAVVSTMYFDTVRTDYHINKAIDLAEKLTNVEQIEKAKNYMNKAMQINAFFVRNPTNSKNIFSLMNKAIVISLESYGKVNIFTILFKTQLQYITYYHLKNGDIDTIKNILTDLSYLPNRYPLIEGILYLTQANYLSDSDPKKALSVFNKSKILLERYAENSPFYAEFISRMARCYNKLGDSKSGMDLYELAYNFGKDGFIKDNGTLRSALSMASFCANTLGDYDKTLHFAMLGYKTNPKNCQSILQLSTCYFDLKQYQKAEQYLKEAMSLVQSEGFSENQKNKVLERLIHIYCKIGDVKNAEYYANLIDDKLLDLKNKTHADVDIFCSLAILYGLHLNNFEKGLSYLKAATEQGEVALKHKASNENIYSSIIIEQTRCNILFKKYQKTKKLQDLESANSAWSVIFKLLDKFALVTDGKGTKQTPFSFEDTQTIVEQSIKSNLAIGDLTVCFNYFESARKQMLRLNGNDKISFEQFGIPQTLMEKEKTLRNELTQLDQKVKQNKDIDVHTQTAFLNKKQELNALLSSLEKQYPNYYHFKYNSETAPLADIQREVLDDQTALIEYFVGDSSIYVFTVLKNDLKAIEIPKGKDFEQNIEALRSEMTQARPNRDATVFAKQSTALYDKILRGPLAALPTTISKLIIAPDGVLSYLPFEVLMPTAATANVDFRQNDFLLKHYQISYAYSANLLMEQKRVKKHDAKRLFAGFAPKYENKDTLIAMANVSRATLTREGAYELKGAQEEVNIISQLLGGQSFVGASATEGVFKREANQYRILHFAMHSLTDDKDPTFSKLLFTLTPKDTTNDNDLTAGELYAMQLNADMAVLSACNTGYGKLSRGEGVMSLARAFTYAGVPATVTSLWKVPDLTTREIMVEFYKNLKSGMSKDAALREAKLTYLKNAPESIAANPYFWAGFVPMGNMDAMDMTEKAPLSIFWILAGLLAIGGLGFYFFKKQK